MTGRVKTRIPAAMPEQELNHGASHAPRSLMPMRDTNDSITDGMGRSEGETMSDYESNLEEFDDCLRAFVRAERAIDRGDLGAGLDWMHAALTGLIHLAEETGQIPENRRPRRLPARSRKWHPPGEAP